MKKVIVKLSDNTASFFDPTQPSGSLLLHLKEEKEVFETEIVRTGLMPYGGLTLVSVVETPVEVIETPVEVVEVSSKELPDEVETPKSKKK